MYLSLSVLKGIFIIYSSSIQTFGQSNQNHFSIASEETKDLFLFIPLRLSFQSIIIIYFHTSKLCLLVYIRLLFRLPLCAVGRTFWRQRRWSTRITQPCRKFWDCHVASCLASTRVRKVNGGSRSVMAWWVFPWPMCAQRNWRNIKYKAHLMKAHFWLYPVFEMRVFLLHFFKVSQFQSPEHYIKRNGPEIEPCGIPKRHRKLSNQNPDHHDCRLKTCLFVLHQRRQLMRDGFVVDVSEGVRSLRHLFLYTDLLLCTRFKHAGRGWVQQHETRRFVVANMRSDCSEKHWTCSCVGTTKKKGWKTIVHFSNRKQDQYRYSWYLPLAGLKLRWAADEERLPEANVRLHTLRTKMYQLRQQLQQQAVCLCVCVGSSGDINKQSRAGSRKYGDLGRWHSLCNFLTFPTSVYIHSQTQEVVCLW